MSDEFSALLATTEQLASRLYERLVRMPNGCLEWTGAHSHGYGVLTAGGKNIYTHRLAWQIVNGPIPKGMFICHTCDNPPCCDPEHLWLGTNADNTADKVAKGRQGINARAQSRKTHCKYGHAFDEANTFKVSGRRKCRKCDAARSRANRARKKVA